MIRDLVLRGYSNGTFSGVNPATRGYTFSLVTAGLSVKKYAITIMDKAIDIIVKDKTNEIKI